MSAVTFTGNQRNLLRRRLELALLWDRIPATTRDECTRTANLLIREIEQTGLSAGAQRRAVEKVVISLEERTA